MRARAAGYAGDGQCDLATRYALMGRWARPEAKARAGGCAWGWRYVWAGGCAGDSGRREWKWNKKAERKAMISYQNSRNYLSSDSPTCDDLPEPPLRQVPSSNN